MKRKISQIEPKDPSPIPISFSTGLSSSKNQFSSKRDDEAKTSEYAFFKKLKTVAGHRSCSHRMQKKETESNRLNSSECDREGSCATDIHTKDTKYRFDDIKNVNHARSRTIPEDFRLPGEDVRNNNNGNFCSPAVEVDLERPSTSFEDMWSTRTDESGRNLRPDGSQHQHDNLFSAKRKKLHQWVADNYFSEIGKPCLKGYNLVSVLLSRLFAEYAEDNIVKIPESETSIKSITLASPYSDSYSKKIEKMSTSSIRKDESDPCLDYVSSVCWLDIPKERSSTTFDYPLYHTARYTVQEPSYDLKGGNGAISRNDSDSALSLPYRIHGFLPLNHHTEVESVHYQDDSLLQREQSPLLLEWNSDYMTDRRTSSALGNTKLITYPIASNPWGDDHEQTLDDGISQLDAFARCTSSVMCLYPPNFYPLPPHFTSYSRLDFGRHIFEGTESCDLDRYPLTLSHVPRPHCVTEGSTHKSICGSSRTFLSPGCSYLLRRNVYDEWHQDFSTESSHLTSNSEFDFKRHFLKEKEETSVNLNHYPLTFSQISRYLNVREGSNHDSAHDASKVFPSPKNCHCFKSKVSNEWHHGFGKEALTPSELDFDLRRKCLLISDSPSEHYTSIPPVLQLPRTDSLIPYFLPEDEKEDLLEDLDHKGILSHFRKDLVNNSDMSSFCFQISFDKQKSCPLLLNQSGWDELGGETYHGFH